MGSPYVWGGTSPSGFDCSGFLQYVHQQVEKDLPRTVAAVHRASTSVSNPSVGDLVFFDTRGGPSHAGGLHWVTISSMDSSYGAPRYIGAGRV
ncbi:C40 family peptidase [Sinobaca sp. H24]|uniref:C40 family peptidase n=1 Tax=Sinobaca sp. H24 TaxID=2923376 RepID=UPI00211176B8|nr:C40 family peptidase [Sinobaca sp. H24]